MSPNFAMLNRHIMIHCLRFFLLLCLQVSVVAGELSQADIVQRYKDRVAREGAASASGSALRVGEKLKDPPVWPLYDQAAPGNTPVGYVFETVDLAPIPGFEGSPIDLLVELDAKGNYQSVALVHQHEPVFLSGLGPGPLIDFLKQYEGVNLAQEVTVASGYGHQSRSVGGGSHRVVVDGVAKATASIRVVNQTILNAALVVARAKLGFAPRSGSALPAVLKPVPFSPMDFQTLLQKGYVQHVVLTNGDLEHLFAGTDNAGEDEEALRHPQDLFADLYVAYLNAPLVGKNLLGEAGWKALQSTLQEDRAAFWIATRGRYALVEEDFTPGSVPQRLELTQNGLPYELRDANMDEAKIPPLQGVTSALIVAGIPHSGLDMGQPMTFDLTVTRTHGAIMSQITKKQITLPYTLPAHLVEYPPQPLPEWVQAWQARWPDLSIIALALLLLSAVLLRPRLLSRDPRRLKGFRLGFLAFTLVYLGWHAQGQLSIVQVTGAVKTLHAGGNLSSFLYDPVSLLLIGFTLISWVVWGRGTFCGWLCPFGALQEFVGIGAQLVRLPQRHLPATWLPWLSRLPLLLLGVLALSAFAWPTLAERGVEVEPFKTAITVGFQREWPYLLWALSMLAAGAFVYKFFCRFLCPLGALMALGGRLRRWNWLPRIPECGQPCQKCKNLCQYQAIKPTGEIVYTDCFQCLDCVGVFHDDQRCSPKLLYARKGKTIRIRPVVSHD